MSKSRAKKTKKQEDNQPPIDDTKFHRWKRRLLDKTPVAIGVIVVSVLSATILLAVGIKKLLPTSPGLTKVSSTADIVNSASFRIADETADEVSEYLKEAEAFRLAGKPDQARRFYEQARILYKQVQDTLGEASV